MNRADAMIRTYLETGSLRACMQEAMFFRVRAITPPFEGE
jgi:hypothetical protein